VRRTTIAPLLPSSLPSPEKKKRKTAGGERIGKRVCASKSSQYLCNRIASPYEESLLGKQEEKIQTRKEREKARGSKRRMEGKREHQGDERGSVDAL